MKNPISQFLITICICLFLAACSKEKQVDKVRIIASDDAGLDARLTMKTKAGAYIDVEYKKNIFNYDKEVDVKPGDSVMCYFEYAIAGTFKYEIKAGGETYDSRSIAATSGAQYARKGITIGYKVPE